MGGGAGSRARREARLLEKWHVFSLSFTLFISPSLRPLCPPQSARATPYEKEKDNQHMARRPHATLAAATALTALACLLAGGVPAAAAAAAPVAASSPAALARTAQNLAGPGWTLSNGEGVSLDVSVPVMALQAMEDAGLVGDPLWR